MNRRSTWSEWHAYHPLHNQVVIYRRWAFTFAAITIAQSALIIWAVTR